MPLTSLTATAIAVVFPATALALFLRLDRHAAARAAWLVAAFAWGAFGAYWLATQVYAGASALGADPALLARGAMPGAEEALKGLILLPLLWRARSRAAGALTGVAAGFGFALAETLLIYLPGAGDGALSTAIGRQLTTTLMHGAAAGVFGWCLGGGGRRGDALRGWMLAAGLHAAFNSAALAFTGPALMLVAAAIGAGSSALLATLIAHDAAPAQPRPTAQTPAVGGRFARRNDIGSPAAAPHKPLMMLEKMRPIAGPSSARITITTTATNTRIRAYSTSPWASSRGRYSIAIKPPPQTIDEWAIDEWAIDKRPFDDNGPRLEPAPATARSRSGVRTLSQ